MDFSLIPAGRLGRTRSPKLSDILFFGYGDGTKALASRNQTKKLRNNRINTQKRYKDLPQQTPDEYNDVNRPISVEFGNKKFDSNASEVSNSSLVPARSDVLQACTVTSGLIGALGVLIRQISHIASSEGWPVFDSSSVVNFSFQVWHLELVVGTVVQLLTSLESLDYLLVSFLPGISEELLFRVAILPLLGISNWTSICAVAALFGVLHIRSGRKYSFAIWATFVGIIYGYVTALYSSICVPMACHVLNNLIARIMWRCSSKSSSKQTRQ